MSEKVCVITGGTSGIGKATAEAMRRRGYTVYELSRRETGLAGFCHIPTDVMKPEMVEAAVAEILRQEIFTQTSKNNVMVSTQASIGIAFFSEYRYNYETLFSAADHALYQAKKEGRNKVVIND